MELLPVWPGFAAHAPKERTIANERRVADMIPMINLGPPMATKGNGHTFPKVATAGSTQTAVQGSDAYGGGVNLTDAR
jgi:hypothetical protein